MPITQENQSVPLSNLPNARHLCPRCHKVKCYAYRFDAFCCEHCNVWLEPKCDSPKCVFCRDRPEKPKDRNRTAAPPPPYVPD